MPEPAEADQLLTGRQPRAPESKPSLPEEPLTRRDDLRGPIEGNDLAIPEESPDSGRRPEYVKRVDIGRAYGAQLEAVGA